MPIPGEIEPLRKRLSTWLVAFPSRRDALTIARSFNCGWRAANDASPAGTAEPARFKSTDNSEFQSSRWDELCVRAPNPQLKLRAIVKSASGAGCLVVSSAIVAKRLTNLAKIYVAKPASTRLNDNHVLHQRLFSLRFQHQGAMSIYHAGIARSPVAIPRRHRPPEQNEGHRNR